MAHRVRVKNRKYMNDNNNVDRIPNTRKKVELSYLTPSQKDFGRKINQHSFTFGIGPAGTGKSFVAANHAMKAYTEGEVDKIIICRPAVEAGGEKIGFLPGNIVEKMEPWLKPILDVFETYWSKQTILDMIDEGKLEFAPISFMRGRSFLNCFVIADEAQNLSEDNLLMLLTRLGEGSKMVITGDPQQKDIRNSCLQVAYKKLCNVPDVAFCYFGKQDVVRHKTVENILEAWEGEVAEEIGILPRFITR